MTGPSNTQAVRYFGSDSTAAEVCFVCDIADCHHIRERRATGRTTYVLGKGQITIEPARDEKTIQHLQRHLTEARNEILAARRHNASLQAKAQKQRNEIGRLTKLAEDQKAQIRDLTFEINKLRAAERQRREMETEASHERG